MKNVLMEMKDKITLRKRAIIETINDERKTPVKWNTQDIDHLLTSLLS